MVPRNKAFARSLVWGHTTLVYYIGPICKYMQCFVCRGCFTPPPTTRVNIRTWEALEQPQMFTGILVRGFYLNSLSSSGLELIVQFVFLVVRFFWSTLATVFLRRLLYACLYVWCHGTQEQGTWPGPSEAKWLVRLTWFAFSTHCSTVKEGRL